MTFQNLPDDWQSMSLADPDLALDVVDLFLGYHDRLKSSALLILCDESGRAVQPVVVNGVDWLMSATERERLFRFLEDAGSPKVVVAVSSPSPIPPTVVMRWWATATEVLPQVAVELLGFYCADATSVQDPVAQAA